MLSKRNIKRLEDAGFAVIVEIGKGATSFSSNEIYFIEIAKIGSNYRFSVRKLKSGKKYFEWDKIERTQNQIVSLIISKFSDNIKIDEDRIGEFL